MVSRSLVKTWIAWFKGSILVRLLGFPAALLTLYLELSGVSPATASLILHRLSRRLRRKTFVCTLQSQQHDMSSIFFVGGADSMDRAQTVDKGARPRPDASSSTASASSSTSTLAQRSPTLPMPHSRSKTTSHVDAVNTGKRLSLQFPIQPAGGSNPATARPRSRPQSWMASSPVLSPEAAPSPENNIMVVLAAQERYVLELKEELNKAEADLKTLKKHYALHEANKRRNDVRKLAPLQPLNTTLIDVSSNQEEDDGSNTSLQQEMERRKALLNNTKSSKRKVFSGSRHLRTLSLLSPDKAYSPSFPQPLDLQEEESTDRELEPSAQSAPLSDPSKQLIDLTSNERYDLSGMPNIQREQIIRAGTQMATDIKNGLFTFIEDIRQATVGDEAVNGPVDGTAPTNSRDAAKAARKGSQSRPALNRAQSSKKATQGTAPIGDDFWKENGLDEPKTTNNKKTTTKPLQTPQKPIPNFMDEEEEWDNWETPNDSYVSTTKEAQDSSDESDADTSGPASSRTSTRYHSKRHDSKASSLTTTSSVSLNDEVPSKRSSIPWADLVKLSPNNLKRTASHLMKEWEKQLTPPPESRNSSHSHGDYLGRSGSPPTGHP